MNRGHSLPIAILLAACVASVPTLLLADDTEDEYYSRLRAIAKNDVEGHLVLASWCRDKERWQLVARQSHTVKSLDPNNAKANLLLELARTHLEKDHAAPRGAAARHGAAPTATGRQPRILTDDEVQRIRRAELLRDDRARIRIDRQLLKDFFDAKRAGGGLNRDRKSFFSLRPIEKALLLLSSEEPRFTEGVTVITDPERMRVFTRDISPLIAKNCATVECHGGGGPSEFQIYGGRVRDNVAYTNFLAIHERSVGEQKLINRNAPEKSLVLTYGLPPQPGADDLKHPIPIRPAYADTNNREYQKIIGWLNALALERPDYGINADARSQP